MLHNTNTDTTVKKALSNEQLNNIAVTNKLNELLTEIRTLCDQLNTISDKVVSLYDSLKQKQAEAAAPKVETVSQQQSFEKEFDETRRNFSFVR